MKVVPYLTQTLMWLIARPLLSIFSGVKIYGKENTHAVPRNAIIAMNHVSQLDPIMIPATLGPFSRLMPVFSVAREKEFYQNIKGFFKIFYGGIFFRMLGSYSIFLAQTGDYELSLKPHIDLLEKGGSLGIFPEGKRTKDGTFGEAKPGVAYLLWRTGVPVIPVAFHGHYKMKARHFFSRKHTITVCYGKPIYKHEMFSAESDRVPPTREELKEVAHKIMEQVREMYEKI